MVFLGGLLHLHSVEIERALIGVDQKISDWFIKITFLVKVETASRLGIKSRFGVTGFSTSDTILGLWCFSL